MNMRDRFAYALCTLLIASGCAMTNETRSDGQTHWMKSCDADDDCGELSCVCGLCTEACDADEACGRENAACAERTAIFGEGACETGGSESRVCALSRDTEVASELACTPDGELQGTGDYEIVLSEPTLHDFTIAGDGTIYVSAEAQLTLMRLTDTGLTTVGEGIHGISHFQSDGDELFALRLLPSDEVAVVQIDPGGQAVRELARTPNLDRDAVGLEVEGGWVYWIVHPRNVVPVAAEIWRAPRESGASVLVARIEAQVEGRGLALLGDDLFVVGRAAAGAFNLYRAPKNGGAVPELIDAPRGLRIVRSDGESLFIGLSLILNADPPVAGPLGLARFDANTREVAMIASAETSPHSLTFDDDDVYWAHDSWIGSPPLANRVVRSRADGTSVDLAAVQGIVSPVAVHDGAVYGLISCDGSAIQHLVRVPLESR
jgi:hypothetical protein